jgi:effector-binding domain-containing protein
MRKWVMGLLGFTALTLLIVFIFIPKQLTISEVTTIKASQNSVWRFLSDGSKWIKWWPVEDKKTLDKYTFKGYNFRITQVLYNAVDVEIKDKDAVTAGKMVMIPLTTDSILIQWNNSLTTSTNPVNRINQYIRARNIKNTMRLILDSLKAFNEDKSRIYKFNIYHTTLKDTTLVATKKITKAYPSIAEIYSLIDHVKRYILSQGAKETDYPMLNITKTDSNLYTTMVAIPTDKKLDGKGDITFKRMFIYKDRVLATDVKGGPETIKQAYDEINTYMDDYKLSVPVIHFEYLVTDRLKETDTTKWITKIYVPII